MAYDGNPEEIDGIRNGALKAILVQDLYNWGYKAVNFAYDAVMGESIDSYYNTGVTLVTLENIDDESIRTSWTPAAWHADGSGIVKRQCFSSNSVRLLADRV